MLHCGALKLDCGKCSDQQKQLRGCDTPSPVPVYTIDGEDIYRCPVKLVTQETAMFFQIYGVCKLFNSLPVPGGILAQTALFLEAVHVVEAISQEAMDHDRK